MSATACGTATGTKSGAQSVSTRSAVRSRWCAISVSAPCSSPAISAFQDRGVLDVAGRLPAARLGQLVDADVAGGPVGECPQLPLHRLAGRCGADAVVVGVRREPGVEVAALGGPPHRGQHPLGLGAGLGPKCPMVIDSASVSSRIRLA